MKFPLLFVLSCFVSLAAFSADGDTLKIQSHDETHWDWNGSYYDTVQFPESGNYRKIIMHYTLGCPDIGCSEWDYTTRIEVSNPINDTLTQWVELVRIITPYAGDKNSEWKHTWDIDVTDYAELFTGERSIKAQYSGWQDGFTITVDFEMIEGTPPRDVVGFDQIYHGSFLYGDANDPIEDHLVPTDVSVSGDAEAALVRMVASGHGFNGNGPSSGNPDNCAEFCDKWFQVFMDNNSAGQTTVWRDDCGSNILQDQTGTWIYNRAGWCPGDVATRYDTDVSSFLQPGQVQSVNVDWEPYTYTGGSSFPINYGVATQVIQYGAWNFETDLSIERILQPSNNDRLSNINPYCGDALVEVKNVGANPITSARIEYWVEGGIEKKSINWFGSLASGESESVSLPMEDFKLYGGMTDNIFHVELASVNSGSDQHADNDYYQTRFDLPAELPGEIIVICNNNSAGSELQYRIVDEAGQIVLDRSNLGANAIVNDTLALEPGCYTMYVEDFGCDGLSFFANNDGNGGLRIHPDEEQIFPWLHQFESGFGCETQFSFSVDKALGESQPSQRDQSMRVYPNPSNERISIELNVEDLGGELSVVDLTGRIVSRSPVQTRLIHLDDLPSGQYLIRYTNGDVSLTEQAIVIR